MIRLVIAFCIVAFGIAPSWAQTTSTFQDVPTSDRSYRDMETLRERGLLTGYAKDHFNGRRVFSRYEFAVAIDRVLRMAQLPAPGSPDTSARSSRECSEAVSLLSTEFKEDLLSIGYSSASLSAAVDALNRHLRDADARPPAPAKISLTGSQTSPGARTPTTLTGIDHRHVDPINSRNRVAPTPYLSSGPNDHGYAVSLTGSAGNSGLGLNLFPSYSGSNATSPLDSAGVWTGAVHLSGTFGSLTSDLYTAQVVTPTNDYGAARAGILESAAFDSPVAAALRGPGIPDGLAYDRVSGVRLGFDVKSFGQQSRITLNAASSTGALTQATTGASNVVMVGTNADLRLNRKLTLSADFGRTITGAGATDTPDPTDANAYNLRLGFLSGGLNVMAGYRYIDPLYYAPGYWGRVGGWLNPSNIQGPSFRAGYDFGGRFGLNVGGDFYSSAKDSAAPGGLGPNDDVNRLLLGFRWDISKNFRTTVDWEGVYWHLNGGRLGNGLPGAAGARPTEHYITLGTGYSLTSNLLFRLTYQIGDFNGQGLLSNGLSRANFSTISSEVAIKF